MNNSFPPMIFADKIKVAASHITYNPGLVFICGGEVDNLSNPAKSVRDHVLRKIGEEKKEIFTRIIQAEEMQSWLDSGAFEDLVLFEKALAYLADKIIIFVEGLGSVAELGAFSFLEDVSEKLLVFISSDHKESSSFITLGPLKKLRSRNDQCVKFYDWGTLGSTKINADLGKINNFLDFIISDIEESLSNQNKRSLFKEDNIEHRLLFLCDILSLFPALQLSEIVDICLMAEIDVSASDMKGYLYILTKTGLLKAVDRGETYYLLNQIYHPFSFLKYKFKDAVKIHDRTRLKVEMIEYLLKSANRKDKKRLSIIKGEGL